MDHRRDVITSNASGSGKLVVVRKQSKADGQDHHPGCSLVTFGDDTMD
jgi:hypothetical protein